MSTWYTVATPEQQERLLGAWEDAPVDREELCRFILDTARDQVLAYAPVFPDGETDIPSRYVYAQLQQATNLWNAGRVSSSGDIGVDTYSYTPRPLDKTVRGIIRPIDGRLHVL